MTEKEKNFVQTFLNAMEREGFTASLKIQEGPDFTLAKRDFLTRIDISVSKRIEGGWSHEPLRETAISFASDRLNILDKQENGE